MTRVLTTLLLLLSLLLPVAACAAVAEIDSVTVEISNGVKSSFVVKNAFTPQIDEAIASGVPTSFTFRAEVNLSHGLFWFDERFAAIEFRHTVKYDTLKQEYSVVREERGREVVRTADNAEMKRLMSVVEPVSLLPTAPMKSGVKYDLRIKAELSEVKLPLSLDYLFFFVKLWDFETDWYYHSFTYR
ncbi:MAG: DUF4390 domain-containing protein [Proteobacteria bacterium]|nr:DUF4390 domain-containing protein [Pseudomonadota bacterium]